MAFFKASTAFDISTLNLTRLFTQSAPVFLNNVNEITGSTVEQDLLGFPTTDGGITRSAWLSGSGFTFNTAGGATGGTVRSLGLFSGSLGDFTRPNFSIKGLSLSLRDLVTAATTPSTLDDLAVVSNALSGNDEFQLSAGTDIINGFSGDDMIDGNAGNDSLTGGAGNDMIAGGEGNDTLIGGAGNDVLRGGAGVDRAGYINATSAVTVDLRIIIAQNTGGAGTDTLSGIESVGGSNFNDTLNGNNRANTLFGGLGNDTLSGFEAGDRLVGGAGQDTLTGGTGRDSFVFDAPVNTGGAIVDTITDFSSAQLDRIELSKAVFAGLAGAAGTTLTESAFFSSATATGANDTSDRVIYNTTTGALYYDADGSGGTAAVQIALIGTTTHAALVFGDFLIIA